MENHQQYPHANQAKLTYQRLTLIPHLEFDIWEKYLNCEENAVAFMDEPDMRQWPIALQGLREWIEQNILPSLWMEMED